MNQNQDKMGTMPVGRLLASVSLPIVVSMLVQALYNIVDSIFVARYSPEAFAAVSLVYPVQSLIIAVSVGTAVGVGSLLSRRLGQQDMEAANNAAVNGLFLTLLSWLLFAVFGLFFSDAFFAGYAADPGVDPVIPVMGAQYMRIVTVGSLGVFVAIMLERVIQATGRSMLTMFSQMLGAVINIILDPILIFGLPGLPGMGVTGAAWATVIGQFAGMGLSIYFVRAKTREFNIRLRGFRPHWSTIRQIYQVGLPSIVMQSIGSVMVLGLNSILMALETAAVSVLGAFFKLQSFIFMPVFGFMNGLIPIVGYNYGARNRKRIEQAVRLGVVVCAGIMLAGTLLFLLLPGPLLSIFKPDDAMRAIGIPALRIAGCCFPVAGVCIVLSGVFQAMGQGLYSLIISVIRQLGVLLPAAWLLARIGGVSAVWWCFPISEIACLIVTIFMFRHTYRKFLRPLAPASG